MVVLLMLMLVCLCFDFDDDDDDDDNGDYIESKDSPVLQPYRVAGMSNDGLARL